MRLFQFYKDMKCEDCLIHIRNHNLVNPEEYGNSGSTIDLAFNMGLISSMGEIKHVDGFYLLNIENSGLCLFDGVGTCDVDISEVETCGDNELIITGVDFDGFMA